jgi:hypothetical protein
MHYMTNWTGAQTKEALQLHKFRLPQQSSDYKFKEEPTLNAIKN